MVAQVNRTREEVGWDKKMNQQYLLISLSAFWIDAMNHHPDTSFRHLGELSLQGKDSLANVFEKPLLKIPDTSVCSRGY